MSCNCTKTFVEGVKSDNTYFDVLNWYRNLYYKEDNRTEQGIMANAINELFMDLKNHQAEKIFEEECKR